MATKVKLIEDGFGQLELNLVSFPRTGNIVAQYKAGTSFTTAEGKEKYLENGMLLKVDGKNRCVEKAAPKAGDIYALNYSTEHMYDERKYALKDFYLNPLDDFYPRLGYLSVGDKFTTNCVCVASGNWTSLKTSFEKNEIYGGACADGYIELTTTAPTVGPVLRVIEFTTMPDGQNAVKFEVIKA